jgi:predicted component of type VI protein secretion system
MTTKQELTALAGKLAAFALLNKNRRLTQFIERALLAVEDAIRDVEEHPEVESVEKGHARHD